jgi:hypothetical protein
VVSSSRSEQFPRARTDDPEAATFLFFFILRPGRLGKRQRVCSVSAAATTRRGHTIRLEATACGRGPSRKRRIGMINRRRFSMGVGAALIGCGLSGGPRRARATRGWSRQLAGDLDKIEAESGGRLGVAVLDTLSGERTGHRADERFPMCSTFKLLAAAAILARVDAERERLDRRIRFEAGDVVVNSPITKDRHGGDGMSLAELCEAAMTASDNTAGNLLLANLGGPAGLTAYARSRTCTPLRSRTLSPPSRGISSCSGWSATRPVIRACAQACPQDGARETRPGPATTARPTTWD